MFELTGKVALITGGTGVLGSSMSEALAEAGAKVAILGRNKQKGEELASAILKKGGVAAFFECDVLDMGALKKAKKEILSKWSKVDILVNGAGGNMAGANVGPDASFFDVNLDEVEKVIDLNFYGTLYPTYVFAKEMADRGQGCIINITSATVKRPMTRVLGYSAAKGAVDNLTKWMSVEFAQKYGEGMRVNAISPGFYLTEQNRTLLTNPDGSLSERGGKIIRSTPAGRMGHPEELKGAVVYLASDAASFVNGTTIIVDGGFDAYSGV